LQLDGEEIVQLIRAAGHKVKYQSTKQDKWKKALKKSCDIIAVAGGDGTVGKVARRLIGSRTPIAVLPMGTANNIAKTLRIKDKRLEDLIKGWSTARCVNFDAGVAKGPWGSQYFVEGFGVGLFAEAMLRLHGKENTDLDDSGKPTQVISSVLTILKKQLQRCQAKTLTVRLDGEELSGDYVVLEALNIRYIGPNLDLAPRADINDGFLDVVFVAKREGAALGRYFADLIKRKRARPNLTIRHGRHLQIEWENSPVHIDDKPWPEDDDDIPVRSNAIHISVEPAALVFLVPKTNRRGR
jgi:diacylglycerol kinase family enzyme